MAKSRSRSPKSRASASRAKGAKKGATKGVKKSAVKRKKTPARAALASLQETPEGLDVKKLRKDIDGIVAKLQKRIDAGDPAKRLPETRDAFMRWAVDIDETVCVAPDGPCGPDMFVGS